MIHQLVFPDLNGEPNIGKGRIIEDLNYVPSPFTITQILTPESQNYVIEYFENLLYEIESINRSDLVIWNNYIKTNKLIPTSNWICKICNNNCNPKNLQCPKCNTYKVEEIDMSSFPRMSPIPIPVKPELLQQQSNNKNNNNMVGNISLSGNNSSSDTSTTNPKNLKLNPSAKEFVPHFLQSPPPPSQQQQQSSSSSPPPPELWNYNNNNLYNRNNNNIYNNIPRQSPIPQSPPIQPSSSSTSSSSLPPYFQNNNSNKGIDVTPIRNNTLLRNDITSSPLIYAMNMMQQQQQQQQPTSIQQLQQQLLQQQMSNSSFTLSPQQQQQQYLISSPPPPPPPVPPIYGDYPGYMPNNTNMNGMIYNNNSNKMIEHPCSVCGEESTLACHECLSSPPYKNTYYCSIKHQKQDWAKHQAYHKAMQEKYLS